MIAKLLLEDNYLVDRVAFIGTRRIGAGTIRSEDVVDNAIFAAARHYKLISGGAKGVDTIAEKTYTRASGKKARVFRPEDAEYDKTHRVDEYKNFYDLAAKAHPNWRAVVAKGPYVVNLMVRNAMIVSYSDIVLAWPSEERTGGTEHGIRLAAMLNKPLEIMP